MAEMWWWIEPLCVTGIIFMLLISTPAMFLFMDTDNAVVSAVLLLIAVIPLLMVFFSAASAVLWLILRALWLIWT